MRNLSCTYRPGSEHWLFWERCVAPGRFYHFQLSEPLFSPIQRSHRFSLFFTQKVLRCLGWVTAQQILHDLLRENEGRKEKRKEQRKAGVTSQSPWNLTSAISPKISSTAVLWIVTQHTFTAARNGSNPSVHRGINGWPRCSISRTIGYYSSLKRKEILSYATTWMNFEELMLREIS